MAITVTLDSVGPSGAVGTTSATSPLTWTHTCASGASALLVGVAVDAGSSDASISAAVTYAGVGMNPVPVVHSGGTTKTLGYVQVFSLLAPATGANTVSVVVSGTGFDGITGGSLSFIGAGAFSAPTYADSAATLVTSGTISVPICIRI